MDSSSDEEIGEPEEELKYKREQKILNNGVLHIQQPEENPCSSKTTDLTTVDTPDKQVKNLTEETTCGQIDAETTNKSFLEKTFKKRSGTTDKGRKYENMVVANLVLQTLNDTKITDFNISSDNENFGDFDDVVVEIETDRGIDTKAIQLKLSGEGNLPINRLKSKTGDFSIKKYFNSFLKIKDKRSQFILFTNQRLAILDETQLQLEGEEFSVKPTKVSFSEDSFDGLRISENVNYYRTFQVVEDEWTEQNSENIQQYQTFFDRFRLYTNQEKLETLTESTMNKFTKMFCSNEEVFNFYVKFISDWSLKNGRKEKLTKKFMQRAIALHLLSSHIEPLDFGSVSDKMKLLGDAICLFDITLLDKDVSNAVKTLWGDLAKNVDLDELNKVRSRYSLSSVSITTIDDVDPKLLSQLLWLMDKCPLIVKEHKNIEKAIQLCPDATFIILGDGKPREWMKDRSVFQSLSDLESNFEKVLQDFAISVQGKEEIKLETAFKQNEEFVKHVSVNKLVEMSTGPCYINGQKETFPNLYIERYLSVNIIDVKYLEHINQNTVVIVNCQENSEIFKISKKHKDSKISHAPIIISKNKCSESEFQKISSKIPDTKTVHYFKFRSNNNLEWIRSRGDISELRNYKLSNHSKNEKEFWSFGFNNNINVITGDPGMGKTELTKSLKNNCCSKYWTVIINPQDVNSLSKTLQTCDASDYLNRFESFILNEKYRHLEQFDREFFKLCLGQNNVVYVWDALDEILTKNLDAASNLILLLSQNGCIQWVTARQHLKPFLEDKFNVMSMSINQFSETEQEDYIRERLSHFISSIDMKKTIEKIKSLFAFTKHVDILGIPLQIFMLTEIFRQNKESYLELLNNKLLLTDLYRYFIDGKFSFFFGGKVPVNCDYWKAEVEKKKEEKLKRYEKIALELIFPDEILKELKIDCSQDLDLVSEDFATVGVVTGLQNGIPQFVHVSFAEYFVALYLSKNFEKTRRDVFFDQKYNNVRFFFDMLVGQKSPVHIAVLYRNFEQLKSYNDEIINRKDDCGRSALHLICSWGQRHPRLTVHKRNDVYVIKDGYGGFRDLLETGEYLEALQFLLNKCDISEKDLLFKITPIECSRESASLGAELELLQSRKLQFPQRYNNSDRINIIYYSAQFGYDEAIKLVIPESVRSLYKQVNFFAEYSYESLLSTAFQNGYLTVPEYLVQCGGKVNRDIYDCETPLYAASSKGYDKVVKVLVKCGAEINVPDNFGRTPLYAASSNGHEKIVNYLVKRGAEVNGANYCGETPLGAASRKGYGKIVQLLVRSGAKISQTPIYLIACLNVTERTGEYLAEMRRRRTPRDEETVDFLVKGEPETNHVVIT
ncbi:uncharacterized protein LOC135138779 isoform X2 [Zophobas morio]|uniref:uncharacterized protein LOC135138779 isoform X2 n=1 Tax=Zophobas morio TaxID=2755281 RepID=UPI003082C32A